MTKNVEKMKTNSMKFEVKALIVLTVAMCALSFFAVGLMYGQTFDNEMLVKLLLFVGGANAATVGYCLYRLKQAFER